MKFLPHGGYALIPTVLTTMAWLASLFQDGCDYARISGPIVSKMVVHHPTSSSGSIEGGSSSISSSSSASTSSTATTSISNSNSNINSETLTASASSAVEGISSSASSVVLPPTVALIPFLEVGLSAYRQPKYNKITQSWEIEYSGRCFQYDIDVLTIDKDDAWKASKMFAFLGLVLGGGGSLFLWFCTTCVIFSPGTWRWVGYELLLAALFQTLSFSWFFNTTICHIKEPPSTSSVGVTTSTGNNICSLGWGSKANIVASLLWGLAAFAIFMKYPSPQSKMMQHHHHDDSSDIDEEDYIDDDDDDDDDDEDEEYDATENGYPMKPSSKKSNNNKLNNSDNDTTVTMPILNSHELPVEGDPSATMEISPVSSKKKKKISKIGRIILMNKNQDNNDMQDFEML